MDIITLDFETYWSDDYTLKKLTTEEYVRDPRFHAHMVGLKVNDKPSRVVRAEALRTPAVAKLLRENAVLCQKAHFDALILSHHYDIRPAFILDTLSMAQAIWPHDKSHSLENMSKKLGLPEKQSWKLQSTKNVLRLDQQLFDYTAPYCGGDCDNTKSIFNYLVQQTCIQELKLIDLTVLMFTEPALVLNSPRLEAAAARIQEDNAQALRDLGATVQAIRGNESFAELLRDCGVEPPTKDSPNVKGPDGEPAQIYAFAKSDDGMKELLDDYDPRVQALAAARLASKSTINETRATRLAAMGRRGPACVYLKYAGAHTLRWSGADKVNWQNLPAGRTGDKEIRLSIQAPAGYRIVVVDLSQIECRLLNWLAGERWVLDAFREGRDLYSELASHFYGRLITKADKIERHMGKTLELGSGFMLGAKRLRITCRGGALGGPPILLTEEDAVRAIQTYRTTHPHVVAFWAQAKQMLKALVNGVDGEIEWGPMRLRGQRIYAPSGSFLDYSNLELGDDGKTIYARTRKGLKKVHQGLLTENVVQWLAREVLANGMLQIAQHYKIVLSTHDEVAFLAPEAQAEDAYQWARVVMKTPPAWCADIPLDAEGGHEPEYSK